MKKFILLFIISIWGNCFPQSLQAPLEKNNFQKLTSYEEMITFLNDITDEISFMKMDFIPIQSGSVEGRKIPVIKVTASSFEDTSKIKILIFAQQHGDEQSGKEGALLLLKKIAEGNLDHLLQNVNLLIVPQMNPDGSEKNRRRNANEKDLNRNHLILTEPETIGLHNLFNQYLPEAALDVHEYFPYSESWKEYGYLKNFDEQFGTATNPNVSESIRNISNNKFLPFIEKYLNKKGFTFQNYLVGGPPNEERLRHSTVDINDGRQSFGILNTFSFILEGKNGKDNFKENIERRAKGQAEAMIGFIEFISKNKNEIKSIVEKEREKLVKSADKKIIIRMEHVKGEKPLQLSLLSEFSSKDSLITIENYHPVIEPLLEIDKPEAYLIPKAQTKIIDMLKNHNIKFEDYERNKEDKIQKLYISKIDSIELEGLVLPDPVVELRIAADDEEIEDLYFVPINQLHGNMIILALEPQSMLGLATYETVYGEYEGFLKEGVFYPIMKVVKD